MPKTEDLFRAAEHSDFLNLEDWRSVANPATIKQLVELVRLQHDALTQAYSDYDPSRLVEEAITAFEEFEKS